MKQLDLEHRQVTVDGVSIHTAEAGNREGRTILFLHGYPESWMAFEPVMTLLSSKFHLLAVDLPGTGKSGEISSCDKRSIAALLDRFTGQLGLKDVILAGHDIGGMIAYSFLRYFPARISKVIILDTAVPGIAPWEEVKRNPRIWHFAFYAVPSLPEALTAGKQKVLFDYFYNTLAAEANAIPEDRRNVYAAAYQEPSALKTSFGWYRAFPQDEKDNAGPSPVYVPVLYVRGDKEFGGIEDYIKGFKDSGLQNIVGKVIPGSGHFSPEEQPEAVAKAITEFIA